MSSMMNHLCFDVDSHQIVESVGSVLSNGQKHDNIFGSNESTSKYKGILGIIKSS